MTIQESLNQHRASVLRRATELQEQQSSLRLYVLVETGLHPELPGLFHVLGHRAVSLFDGTPEQALDSHSPRLIDLRPDGETQPIQASLLDQLLNLTRTSPCVSWLASNLSLEALATHLRSWHGGKLLDTEGSELGEVVIRFSDARVLPGFMDTLSPEQYGELMRPIALWAVWLRSRRWQEWTPPVVNPLRAIPPIQTYTLHQQARLDRSTRVDRIQSLIEDQLELVDAADPSAQRISQEFFSLPHDLRFQRLDRILARSARHELADTEAVLYGWLALGVHEHFDEHEDVRAAIGQGARDGESFAQAVSRIPPSTWDALRARAIRDIAQEQG